MDKYFQNENSIVRNQTENGIVEDAYDVERRKELVSNRIKESKEITERNKELIFNFVDDCALRGLSKLRVVSVRRRRYLEVLDGFLLVAEHCCHGHAYHKGLDASSGPNANPYVLTKEPCI